MGCKVYLPTIHLFAYSRGKKSENLLEVADNIDSDWLWKQCNQVIKTKLAYEFNLKDFLRKENRKVPAENLIDQELSNVDKPDFIDIPVDKKIHSYYIDDYFPISIQQQNKIHTEIYPLKLYDSYALGLNFYPPRELNNKKFNLEEIKKNNLKYHLNPENCLVLSQQKNSEFFLGQTILITAKLNGKNKNQSSEWLKNNIADQYLEALFPEENQFRKPAFNRAGKLFGKPIFEYGISRQLDNYIHVLVWLVSDKDKKNILEKSYSNLLDLFFFRAKVINAYKETRKQFIKAKVRNFKIEKKLEGMVMGSSSRKKAFTSLNLKEINYDLIDLTQMSVRYANMLRNIEDHQNTIVDNTRNYTDKIREIKSIFPNETLGFLIFFGERTCRSFKDQVAAELGYFQHGIDLVNNVVDALRGQIAIEQTNRERQLENSVTSLAISIAVAGNVASSYEAGSIAEKGHWDFDFYHFTYSFILSMFVSLIVWKGVSWFLRWRRKKKQLIIDAEIE